MLLITDKQILKSESESYHFLEYVQGYWDILNFASPWILTFCKHYH